MVVVTTAGLPLITTSYDPLAASSNHPSVGFDATFNLYPNVKSSFESLPAEIHFPRGACSMTRGSNPIGWRATDRQSAPTPRASSHRVSSYWFEDHNAAPGIFEPADAT